MEMTCFGGFTEEEDYIDSNIVKLSVAIKKDNLSLFKEFDWLYEKLNLLLNYNKLGIEMPQDLMLQFNKLNRFFYTNSLLFKGLSIDEQPEEYLKNKQNKLYACTDLASIDYDDIRDKSEGANKFILKVYDAEEAFCFGDFLNYLYEDSNTPYRIKKLIHSSLNKREVWWYLDYCEIVSIDDLELKENLWMKTHKEIHDQCCVRNKNMWINGLEEDIDTLIEAKMNNKNICGLFEKRPLGKAVYLIERYAEQFEDRPVKILDYLEDKLKGLYSYSGVIYRGFRTPNRHQIGIDKINKSELLSCTSSKDIRDIFSSRLVSGSKIRNSFYLTGEVQGAFNFGELINDLKFSYEYKDESEILVRLDDIKNPIIVTRNMEYGRILCRELPYDLVTKLDNIYDKINIAMLEYMGPRDLNEVVVDYVKYNSVRVGNTLYRGDCIHSTQLQVGNKIRLYNTLASFTTDINVANKFSNIENAPDFYSDESFWSGFIEYSYAGLEGDILVPVVYVIENTELVRGLNTDRFSDRYNESEYIVYTDNLEFEILDIKDKYVYLKVVEGKDLRLLV